MKRAVKDIPIFLDNRLWTELYEIVNREGYNYKTNREAYVLRDRALISLLILSGLRINEALRLKRLQFREYEDKILLANAETLKHGNLREEIILPKKGNLAPFTLIFEEWLKTVTSDEAFIFPSGSPFSVAFKWDKHLSDRRAYIIVSTATGKFPHWFRTVCENVYGRIVFKNDAWKLKEFMGLKNLDSTTPYINSSWKDDEKRIYTV